MECYSRLKIADVCFKSQSPVKYCTRAPNIVKVKDLNLSQVYYGSMNTFTAVTPQQYTQYIEH